MDGGPGGIVKSAAKVRDALARLPGVYKVPAEGIELFLLRDFLDAAECRALIRLIDADREPSALLADDPDPEFRTSESCNMDPRDPTVRAIERKIAGTIAVDPACGETIQGQRYAVGQQFKPHHDFFFTSEPYWPAQEANGGQRTWTAMMFLNAVEEGGHTVFPTAKVRIRPRPGNLLVWNNLDEAGAPNMASLHQGAPVVAGVKYVITKWYRERPWLPGLNRTAPSR